MPSLFYSVSLVSRASADDTGSGNDSEHHGPSDKTTRIVVGVVVGGVAAIAITAGIIFFFMKKRKWDRIRQCEERLIDYQLATGYSSKLQSRSVTPEDYLSMMASSPPALPPPTATATMNAYDPSTVAAAQGRDQGQGQGYRPGSRARGMSAPASTTLSNAISTVSPEAPPPAYQSLHPRYDPSRYSQISTRFSSSFEIPRSSTSTFGIGNESAVAAAATARGPPVSGIQSYDSSLGVGGMQYPQYHYQPGSAANWPYSSSSASTTTTGTAASPAPNIASASTRGSRSQSESGERGPRRPRPVLSRLITNL
ncbi:hypothetical protein BDW68DRAFT_167747 [Aspergillus falconensis]